MPPSTLSGFTEDQPGTGVSQVDEPVQMVVQSSYWRARQASFLAFLREEDGATAVEYAVMLSLIAGTVIAGFLALTNATLQSFETSANELAQ